MAGRAVSEQEIAAAERTMAEGEKFVASALQPEPARIWIEGSLGKYGHLNGCALTIQEAERMKSQLEIALAKARQM